MRTFLLLVLFCTSLLARSRADEALRVACVGDSITEGSGYPIELGKLLGAGYLVRNFGVSATTLLSAGEKPWLLEKKAAEAFAFDPQLVVIMLGTNDTKPQNYRHVADFDRDLTALVEKFTALPAHPRVWLATPCPVYGAGNWGIDNGRLEAGILPAIRRTAAALKLPLIEMNTVMSQRADLFSKDNVHPRGGALPMAAAVFEALTGKAAPPAR